MKRSIVIVTVGVAGVVNGLLWDPRSVQPIAREVNLFTPSVVVDSFQARPGVTYSIGLQLDNTEEARCWLSDVPPPSPTCESGVPARLFYEWTVTSGDETVVGPTADGRLFGSSGTRDRYTAYLGRWRDSVGARYRVEFHTRARAPEMDALNPIVVVDTDVSFAKNSMLRAATSWYVGWLLVIVGTGGMVWTAWRARASPAS